MHEGVVVHERGGDHSKHGKSGILEIFAYHKSGLVVVYCEFELLTVVSTESLKKWSEVGSVNCKTRCEAF